MIRRFLNILKSLKTKEVVHEDVISTSIDDMKEGSRTTFDPKRVNQLLIKADLLEPDDSQNKTDPKT